MLPGNVPTAHEDQFIRSMLPPQDLWPEFDYSADHLKSYPNRINAAAALIDTVVEEGYGDKIAYILDDQTWTYRQLLEQANRIARTLVADYGLVSGNRVLLRSRNTPMMVACWLGVIKAGGICVSTMPLLRAKDLTFIMNRVRVRFALCEVHLADEMNRAKEHCDALEQVGFFTPMGKGEDPQAEFDRAVKGCPAFFDAVPTAADDVAVITFTSGTTGNPKAATHFHRDVLASSDSWPQSFTIAETDVLCGSPSLAFTYGLAAFLYYPIRFRASTVMVPAPTPENILQAVQRHGVTTLFAVPTMYNAMLGVLKNYDIKSLKKCGSAGENLMPILWEKWHRATDIRIVNGIGATEFMSHFLAECLAVKKPGSTGKPVPGYTVKIVDEEGNPLPPGNPGFIAVRGPTGCRYLDDVDRQRKFVKNGWNVPGDLFEQDEDGYFWFIDRADDMIISSGYNISPQEVERAVLEHPSVAECAVIGETNEERGKIVCACVVLKPGVEESDDVAQSIKNFVKETIAPYKYPRSIRFFSALPRTPTGKLQRFMLKS